MASEQDWLDSLFNKNDNLTDYSGLTGHLRPNTQVRQIAQHNKSQQDGQLPGPFRTDWPPIKTNQDLLDIHQDQSGLAGHKNT